MRDAETLVLIYVAVLKLTVSACAWLRSFSEHTGVRDSGASWKRLKTIVNYRKYNSLSIASAMLVWTGALWVIVSAKRAPIRRALPRLRRSTVDRSFVHVAWRTISIVCLSCLQPSRVFRRVGLLARQNCGAILKPMWREFGLVLCTRMRTARWFSQRAHPSLLNHRFIILLVYRMKWNKWKYDY